jgi:hypothetical protein
MSVDVAWNGGGTAVIDVLDDDRVELISTRAFAPGSRPEGTVALAPARAPDAASGGAPTASRSSIWLKVHGSRRQDDGTYRVKGRLLNVRREMLDLLKEVVRAPNGGKSSTP